SLGTGDGRRENGDDPDSRLSSPDSHLQAPPDPHAIVHELEAWMPEAIAAHKFRGFVHDYGGEVLESVPGRIRVMLGASLPPGRKALSWLGLAKRNGQIELDLTLRRPGNGESNLLQIIVAMRSPGGCLPSDPHWRARCDTVYCNLRGYLLGRTGAVKDAAV